MFQRSLVAIDIGNTTISIGVFNRERLVRKTKVFTRRQDLYLPEIKRVLRKAGSRHGDYNVMIASVVPRALAKMKGALSRVGCSDVYVAGENVKIPIENLYGRPNQVGQDRLVNAYAALELYGTPAVVIDLGTAVTFDCVSKRGEYLGGLILPGLRLSLEGLHERTALLPKTRLAPTDQIIGRSTTESMRAGVLFGFGAACDGLVNRYKAIFGKSLKVIATGGDSRLIKRYSHVIQVVDEDLTLKGLRLALQHSEP